MDKDNNKGKQQSSGGFFGFAKSLSTFTQTVSNNYNKIKEDFSKVTQKVQVPTLKMLDYKPTKKVVPIAPEETVKLFTQFYIYTLNESSIGMKYTYNIQTKAAKLCYEKRNQLIDDLDEYFERNVKISEGIVKSSDQLAGLNGTWTESMGRKVALLMV